jgi:hypothetical protein
VVKRKPTRPRFRCTIQLDPFFLLVLWFSPSIPPVEDWPIGTDSYPMFPIYTQVFPHVSILLATCLLAGLLNYSSTLKMEAICSSETSGTTLRTTRRHIPEEDTLQNHRCENLKSYRCSLSVTVIVVTPATQATHCTGPRPVETCTLNYKLRLPYFSPGVSVCYTLPHTHGQFYWFTITLLLNETRAYGTLPIFLSSPVFGSASLLSFNQLTIAAFCGVMPCSLVDRHKGLDGKKLWVTLYRFSVAKYLASIGNIIDEWWIERDMQGGGRGLIEVLSLHLPGETEESHENLSQH